MECCCLTSVLLGFLGVLIVCVILPYISSLRKTYSIKGKHVLITGGSSGIGKCVARYALKRGASLVTLVARNKEKLYLAKEELIAEHKLTDDQINVIIADVGNTGTAPLIKKELSSLPPVDVLVNSAGITQTTSFLDTSREAFESIMRTNVMGLIEVTRAVLPSMIDRCEGRIVFVSSQAAQFPMYGYTAYASSKHALRGVAEVLQQEVHPYNIKIIVSYPPDTDTPQLREELNNRSPMVTELAKFSTVLKPDQVASEILDGVERGQFSVHHGFDGFMLKTLTAGVSPLTSIFDLVVQLTLTGLFRLVSLWYLKQFYSIVYRSVKNKKQ